MTIQAGEWPVRERALERALSNQPLLRRIAAKVGRDRIPPGVYILAYHSVVDAREHEPWEAAYAKARTSLGVFRAQLETLTARMRPIRLDEAPAVVEGGPPSEPLLVVTFDDAYANIARGAADVCTQLGISPTVFVNAEFSSGRAVYYRVLAALLAADGHMTGAQFDETKNDYVPGETEAAVGRAWTASNGGAVPRVHLTYDELRTLAARGWTVGNHTRRHATLATLPAHELDDAIAGNERELAAEGLAPLSWLAYPNGLARHVGVHVAEWLAAHPGYAGLFAGGGVNVVDGGTEWFRIPVGDEDPARLLVSLRRSAEATSRL